MRHERFDLFVQPPDCGFLLPKFAPLFLHRLLLLRESFMFFEELIEQHRVDRFIAHRVNLAVPVTHHQMRINLRYVFSNQSKLRDTLGGRDRYCFGL